MHSAHINVYFLIYPFQTRTHAVNHPCREKICEMEQRFYELIKPAPYDAISVAHRLIAVLTESSRNKKHFHYTDVQLLRRLHLRVSTLCMKTVGSVHLSVEHLRLAAGYCALGLGYHRPETLRLLATLEKRAVTPLTISELPLFVNAKIAVPRLLENFIDEAVQHHASRVERLVFDDSALCTPNECSPQASPHAPDFTSVKHGTGFSVVVNAHAKNSFLPSITVPSPPELQQSPTASRSPINSIHTNYIKISSRVKLLPPGA